jgi:hypothetical protein
MLPIAKKRSAWAIPWIIVALSAVLAGPVSSVRAAAQASDPAALQAIQAAVESELRANATDHSAWAYRDHDATPGKDAVYQTIETPQGTLRRMLELGGRPLNAQEEQAETQRIVDYVHSPSEQAKARRNGAHDDAQAEELLKMLPRAFVWTIQGQDAEELTLNFRPNPAFDPPNMQAHVMGQMGGQVVIARQGNRIRTLRGSLTDDVNIGWGLVKLNRGGTFDVERRQVGGGHWQITETHVHILGHALLFHSISQQEDEVKTEWHPSTAPTLADAARELHATP